MISYIVQMAADSISRETVPSGVYGDIGKGGLQIQHHMQCHCSHSGQQDDADRDASRYS